MAQADMGNAVAIAILNLQGLCAERVLDVKINLEPDEVASITVTYAIDKAALTNPLRFNNEISNK
jgi:hypothetical protein